MDQITKLLKLALVASCLSLGGAGMASAEIVAVVNTGNSAQMDADTLKRIFLGKIGNFPGGPKVLVGELESGDARKEFLAFVGKSESKLKAHWSKLIFTGKAKPPKKFSTAADLKSWIASTANGIGFLNKADVDGTVKVAGTLK